MMNIAELMRRMWEHVAPNPNKEFDTLPPEEQERLKAIWAEQAWYDDNEVW